MLPSRSKILVGSMVTVFDHRTKNVHVGKVQEIWTKAETHKHGIKVKLDTDRIGRVIKMLQSCGRLGCGQHEDGYVSVLFKSSTGKLICNDCFDQENQIQQQFGSQGVALFWK